jgi:hypothetical protein
MCVLVCLPACLSWVGGSLCQLCENLSPLFLTCCVWILRKKRAYLPLRWFLNGMRLNMLAELCGADQTQCTAAQQPYRHREHFRQKTVCGYSGILRHWHVIKRGLVRATVPAPNAPNARYHNWSTIGLQRRCQGERVVVGSKSPG